MSTTFTPPNSNPVTVGQIVANQVAYASYATDTANEFIGKLQDSIEEEPIEVDGADFSNPDYLVANLGQITNMLNTLSSAAARSVAPVLDETLAPPPLAPTNFVFSTVPETTVPEFTSAAPALTIPDAPAGAETLSAPAEVNIDDVSPLGAMPDPELPAVPVFRTIDIPGAPVIEIPEFNPEVDLPADNLLVPTNNFSWAEAAYQSTMLDKAQAKLLADLENGSYGIETADEAALWERDRARQIEATNFAIEEIQRSAAARGFPLPPGDLNVAVQRAVQDASNKLSAVSRDIALKRADMYVENRKFTLQEVRAIESVLISFHNSLMERALNAKKAILELGIQVFNAQVAKHNARLEAYKAEQQVFESKIRAALLQVEGYRSIMEGKRLELQSQTQQVELYKAQLAGINATIEIYKTKAEVQREKVNVQRLRLDIFRGRVDAYAAQVQAKVSVMQAYEARIRGEVARVQAYEVEARAYTAKVEGIKARVDTLVARLRAETEKAQTQVKVYEGQIAGFRAELERKVQLNSARINKYQADTTRYSAEVQAAVESAQVGVAQERLGLDMRAKAIDAVIANAQVKLQALAESAKIRVATNNTVGDYIRTSVAAALSSLTTLSAQAT